MQVCSLIFVSYTDPSDLYQLTSSLSNIGANIFILGVILTSLLLCEQTSCELIVMCVILTSPPICEPSELNVWVILTSPLIS